MVYLLGLFRYFLYRADKFSAGALKWRLSVWQQITSDLEVLTTVSGLHIDFLDDIAAVQPVNVFQQFSPKEETFVSNEITKLLQKGVISISKHEINEFISPIFLVPKDNDSFRMILNLRALNENMPFIHFKMDTFASVVNLLRPGCFMCSVDIKDAYYTVPINQNHKKYLKFKFKGMLYNFNCLPNGLSSGARKFTKLLKPALAYLRNRGFIIVAYVDDIMIIDESYEKCLKALIETTKLYHRYGIFSTTASREMQGKAYPFTYCIY